MAGFLIPNKVSVSAGMTNMVSKQADTDKNTRGDKQLQQNTEKAQKWEWIDIWRTKWKVGKK